MMKDARMDHRHGFVMGTALPCMRIACEEEASQKEEKERKGEEEKDEGQTNAHTLALSSMPSLCGIWEGWTQRQHP